VHFVKISIVDNNMPPTHFLGAADRQGQFPCASRSGGRCCRLETSAEHRATSNERRFHRKDGRTED
jgi:hypothetical protein